MHSRPAGPRRSGALALLVLLFLGACGDDTSSTSSREAAPAPTATGAAATRGSGALGGASAVLSQTPAPARSPAGEPVSSITVVATDNVFTPSDFRVRAGAPFAVTLENRGQAVHDWRVRGLADDQGRDAGTRLLPSGQSEAVTLTIERPGEYALYCEVHPVDMRGKLTVQ